MNGVACVLVIDDDVDVCDAIALVLGAAGYLVSRACDGGAEDLLLAVARFAA